jgi:predicted ATPase/transcriptional regulator with XRE-family HTH domain
MVDTQRSSKTRLYRGEGEQRDEAYEGDSEELLVLYRKRSGWSQEELARRLNGVSTRSIRNWEAGANQPKPETLCRLIAVYATAGVFVPGREIDEARQLWQRVKSRFDGQTRRQETYPLFDEARFTWSLGDRVARTSSGTAARAGALRPWRPAPLLPRLSTNPSGRLTAPVRRTGNLPLLPSSLLERRQETEAIRQALARTRLLTLTGPGGVGKTTLLLMTATAIQAAFPDGVWFIDLAPLTQPDAPMRAAAQALGISEEADRALTQTLVRRLHEKHLLLLLDNCEHLLDGCADLVTRLLQACPHVKILASGREPIRTQDEMEWRVSPLNFPVAAPAAAEDLLQYESVALFLQCARSARPSFEITEANAAAVGQVCRHLDGIPLAIELAAARLSSFTVEDLSLFLENSFTLLSGGHRDDRPRQQTMQESIQWSYDLLRESERQLWRRLSVFTGGWTLAAAEAVCADDSEAVAAADIPKTLAALVDKSIVLPVQEQGDMRYRLLETVRQFGQARLAEDQEDRRLKDRHLAYCATFAEQVAADLLGADAPLVVSQIEAEWPNLSTALRWSADTDAGVERQEGEDHLATRGRVTNGLRLAVALNDFWRTRWYASEARALLAPLIESARQVGLTDTSEFAQSLIVAGWLAQAQNDFLQAQRHLQEALCRFEALDDAGGIGIALAGLGFAALEQGNFPLAETYLTRSIDVYEQTEDTVNREGILFMAGVTACYAGDFETASARLERCRLLSQDAGAKVHIARALFAQGLVALYRGEAKAARRLLDKAVGISSEADNSRLTAYALHHAGILVAESGDVRTALENYQESLSLWRGVGMKMGLAFALSGLADWRARFGAPEEGENAAEQAALLCGATTELLRSLGAALPPLQQRMLESACERARARLGEGMFHATFVEGQISPLDEMVELALSLRPVVAEGACRAATPG